MGYSCTARASFVEETFSAYCVASTGSSNTWKTEKGEFFYERGRETDSGAIVGSVWKFVSEERVIRVGSYKISAEGEVVRFPNMTSSLKKAAEKEGAAKYERTYGPKPMFEIIN